MGGAAAQREGAGSEHSFEQIAAGERIRAHNKRIPFAAGNEKQREVPARGELSFREALKDIRRGETVNCHNFMP